MTVPATVPVIVMVVEAVGEAEVRVSEAVPRLQDRPVDATQASVTLSWYTDAAGDAVKLLSGPPERETETGIVTGRLAWLMLVGATAMRKLP